MSILSQIAAGAAKRNTGGGRSGSAFGGPPSSNSGPQMGRQPANISNGGRSWWQDGNIDGTLGRNVAGLAGAQVQMVTTPWTGIANLLPGSAARSGFAQGTAAHTAVINRSQPAAGWTPWHLPGLPQPIPGARTQTPAGNPNAAYNAGLNAFTQNQVGNYDMALQRSQTGFALRGAGYDGVQNAINQSLGTDLQGVDLNRMTTEVNRQSNVGDIQDINSQRRINEGMNATELGKLLTQENMLTDLYGQAGLTSNREQARVKQLERDEMQRSISEQSANGATSTVAARTNARLTGEASDDEIAKIREGYTAEGTRFRASIADINSGRDSLNWDLRNSNLSLDQQARHLYDRDQLLSIEAARHNVDEQHLRNTANERLAQLGLDRAVSFGQLLEAQSSHDINVANAATQLFQGIAAYAASHPSA